MGLANERKKNTHQKLKTWSSERHAACRDDADLRNKVSHNGHARGLGATQPFKRTARPIEKPTNLRKWERPRERVHTLQRRVAAAAAAAAATTTTTTQKRVTMSPSHGAGQLARSASYTLPASDDRDLEAISARARVMVACGVGQKGSFAPHYYDDQ